MSLAVSEMSISPIIVTSVVFLDSLKISSAARFLSLFLFLRRFDFLRIQSLCCSIVSVGCHRRGRGGKYVGWRLGCGYGTGLVTCLGKKCCGGNIGPINLGGPRGL